MENYKTESSDLSARPSSTLVGLTSTLAVVLCFIVFLLDVLSKLEAAVSILYLLAIAVGCYGRGILAVKLWTFSCLGLSILSFTLTHAAELDPGAVFRLIFSAIGILVVGALLIMTRRANYSETALENSERNFRKFGELVPVGVWSHDPVTGRTFMNRLCQELTGATAEEVAADWHCCFHPEDLERYEQLRMEGGVDDRIRQLLVRIGNADNFRWASLTRTRLREDSDPERAGWIGAIMDIDQAIRDKEEIQRLNRSLEELVQQRTLELNRSELRFSSLFQYLNIPCAEQEISEARRLIELAQSGGHENLSGWEAADPTLAALCRESLRFTMANAPLLTLVGCDDRAKLLSLPLSVWIEDIERLQEMQLNAMFSDVRHLSISVTIVDKQRNRIPVALNMNALDDWSVSFVTFTDISDQQRAHEMVLAAQTELARAGRAATIGAISSSLIHELNQPILSVGLEAKNCRRWLDRVPPDLEAASRSLDRLSANADRMGAIVRLAREHLIKKSRSLVPVDLCALLHDTLNLLEREIGVRGVTVQPRCTVEPAWVNGDPVELQQVLINLIINAADAMRGAEELREIVVEIERTERNRIAVAVLDQGPGIPDASIEKLFNPFFTTKSEGMGMGLQICRSIVEAFGGVISAENRPNAGAAFRFELPALSEEF